jgi:hypothetical protein
MSVVYAGTPLRDTGWSNVTVATVVATVAAVTAMGVVGCGRFAPAPARAPRRFVPGLRRVSEVIMINLLLKHWLTTETQRHREEGCMNRR